MPHVQWAAIKRAVTTGALVGPMGTGADLTLLAQVWCPCHSREVGQNLLVSLHAAPCKAAGTMDTL